jgi:hypothetical protein
MTPRFSLQRALGLLLLLQAFAAQAQPAADPGESVESGDGGDGSSRLSLQLFEFLGEFTTEEGDWVDPALLMEGDIVGSARTEMGREGQNGAAQAPRAQNSDDASGSSDNCVEPRCKP